MKTTLSHFIWILTLSSHLQGVAGRVKNHPLFCLSPQTLPTHINAHALSCCKWAGQPWKKGHDFVIKALAFEIRLLGMGAENSYLIMKTNYAHPTSQNSYIAITSDGHLQITNAGVDRSALTLMLKPVTLCYGYWRWWQWFEGQMECWQDCQCPWKIYPYTGRGWKVQVAWNQLCCCGSCPFSLVLAVWRNWLPGFVSSIFFGYHARQHDTIQELVGLAQLSPSDLFQFLGQVFSGLAG